MFQTTNYEVIISPTGEQTLRTTSTNCSTVIDIAQKTGAVRIQRRV